MLILLLATLVGMDDPTPGLKRLEGEWVLASLEYQGKPYADAPGKRRLKIKGDEFVYFSGDAKMFTTKVTRFDPASRPGAIDLTRDRDHQTIWGIYKLEGDLLTICTSSRGGRPTEFTTGPGSPNQLNVYKRTKP